MAPPQPESSLLYDHRMDETQYASGYDLHPELQSYSSYDVALGAGRVNNPQGRDAHSTEVHGTPGPQGLAQPSVSSTSDNFAQPKFVDVSYPLPNTWAVNNTDFSSAQGISSFQHGQFPTLTNANDDQSSIFYEPWYPSSVFPSHYALEEADLLAPSTGIDQSGITFFPTDVHNAVIQSYVPSLSQSTPVGLSIDAAAEVLTATPRPTSIGERSDESPPDLHGPIQTPEPNVCQDCTQSFASTAALERHAKSLHHNAFECKCGKPYARLDNLKRHWDQTPKFPCPHCNLYTGANAFAREDHLTQHLRTYHRINNSGDDNDTKTPHPMQFYCTWPNCTQQQRSFGFKSQYTAHMRRIHNYSPFPCLVQGCVKTAGKGYFREMDLIKHSQEVHSIKD